MLLPDINGFVLSKHPKIHLHLTNWQKKETLYDWISDKALTNKSQIANFANFASLKKICFYAKYKASLWCGIHLQSTGKQLSLRMDIWQYFNVCKCDY